MFNKNLEEILENNYSIEDFKAMGQVEENYEEEKV
jgi:hypothetical protein